MPKRIAIVEDEAELELPAEHAGPAEIARYGIEETWVRHTFKGGPRGAQKKSRRRRFEDVPYGRISDFA